MVKTMKSQIIASLILGIFLIGLASASISCEKNILDNNNLSTSCTNNGNSNVIVSTTGQGFSIGNINTVLANSTQLITISINTNSPLGSLGGILFDGNQIIQVNNVQQPNLCQLNPSLVWNVPQTVQLNTKFDTALITFDPVNCPSDLILSYSNVHISGGITTQAGQLPIALKSVSSQGVVLSINTEGLSTQTYSSSLDISVFGKIFQYPFNVLVTSGTTQTGNFSLDNLPICSLTGTVLNLNQSYSLVCTGLIPDVTISPIVDNDYIIGTGVQKTNSQFVWYFKPIKYGNTIIKSKFYYQNSEVGYPYSQEVKISSSGSSVAGTSLKAIFTPSLDQAKDNEPVIIQIVDNKSNSLVNSPEILINAIPLVANGTIFSYNFVIDRVYDFRAKVNGYDDLVMSIKLSSKEANLTISPETGDSDTLFNIFTNENISLFIDGMKVDNNHFIGNLIEGNHNIFVTGEGYFDINKNITVDRALRTILNSDFKKGVPQIISLTKNASWELIYKSSQTSTDNSSILVGNSDIIQFTPDKSGIYQIYSNGKIVGQYETKKTNWNKKWWFMAWYWWILIGGAISIILIRKRNKSENVGGNINLG